MEEIIQRKQRGGKSFQKERTVRTKGKKMGCKGDLECLKLFINFGLNVKRIW